MQQLKPKPTVSQTKQAVFVHTDLRLLCIHVFVRRDSIRRPLQAPYDGPFLVLKRSDKLFKVNVNGKPSTISIDRMKPAFIPNTDSDISPVQQNYHSIQQQRQTFIKLVLAVLFNSDYFVSSR
ncbi:gag-pol polyprotein [Nephila pilipes]|uniref:Gag-pol polyprotein n=1 Tax=Nephila pilipes TaxID=299642 RepID=A0A8X6UEZ4_NEPPI|nr:gag-pol polyprotein [Nephila pilipes]